MSWTSSEVRLRRPWVTVVLVLVPLALLAPVESWASCGSGPEAGACIERTRTLAGFLVPTSLHPALWFLSGLAAGVLAWTAVTALARRAERIERVGAPVR